MICAYGICPEGQSIPKGMKEGDDMEPQEVEIPENTPIEETGHAPSVGATATATAHATADTATATATATAIARAGDSNLAAAQNDEGNNTTEDSARDNLSEIISNAVLEALRRYDQETREHPADQGNDTPGQNQHNPDAVVPNSLLSLLKSAFGVIFVREADVIGNRTVRLDTTTVEFKRALLAALLFVAQSLLLLFGFFCMAVPFIGPCVEYLKNNFSYNTENPVLSVLVGFVMAYVSRIVRVMRIETCVMDDSQITNNLSVTVAIISALATLGSLLFSGLSLLNDLLTN